MRGGWRHLEVGTAEDRGLEPGRPVVLLLPGVLGSSLISPSPEGALDLVWIDPLELLHEQGLERMRLRPGATEGLSPHLPLRFVYRPMELRLASKGFHVVPFAFDWRRPIDEAAEALGVRIRRLRQVPGVGPIHVVGHSMGCLVTRRYAQLHPEEALDSIRSAVFLAPPFRGSFAAVRALAGQSALIDVLRRVEPERAREMVRTFQTFPGFLDLFPDPAVFPSAALLFEPSSWPEAAFDGEALARGLRFREELRRPCPLMPRSSVILGQAWRTLDRVAAEDGRWRFEPPSARGDRTVPLASAYTGEARSTWQTLAIHMPMPLSVDVMDATTELLRTEGASAGPLSEYQPSAAAPDASENPPAAGGWLRWLLRLGRDQHTMEDWMLFLEGLLL